MQRPNPVHLFFITTLFFSTNILYAQTLVTLTLDLDHPGHAVSPRLYGLMTEEINYSYAGGVFGELVKNRNFIKNGDSISYWHLVKGANDDCYLDLYERQGINDIMNVSLHLDIEKTGGRTGIANEGYWGFPVKPATLYSGSIYVRQSSNDPGNLTVALESTNGETVYAKTEIKLQNGDWQKYQFTLKTQNNMIPTSNARLVITTDKTGEYWFSQPSLFPPTYNNRPNGNRADIMQLLADMKPSFLRFPGGNYLEGDGFSERWDWKKTIGPVEQRPGHVSPWGYFSTDGMGLLEFLEWCEDLKMEPLVAVFAGFVLNKDFLTGPYLQPFVDDALDEIEYITGDASTKWGAQRVKDGHPQPFSLKYVEIGNEDGFDYSGSYRARYVQFYDAIKAKYPDLQIISTAGGKDPLGGGVPAPPFSKLKIVDEHYYRTASEMEANAHQFDSYNRNGPKVFVGEWATREGGPTPNFNGALGDAAWMTGMERNSDIVIMSCYAPLFVNVNPGAMQWRSDLIGYNTLNVYGSPSYYAQKLFSAHIGNRVINITEESPAAQTQMNSLFYVATIDTVQGKVYLKLVNTKSVAQDLIINLKSSGRISSAGKEWVLKANDPLETNSITDPRKIIPIQRAVKNMGKNFHQVLPAYSITVMELGTGNASEGTKN